MCKVGWLRGGVHNWANKLPNILRTQGQGFLSDLMKLMFLAHTVSNQNLQVVFASVERMVWLLWWSCFPWLENLRTTRPAHKSLLAMTSTLHVPLVKQTCSLSKPRLKELKCKTIFPKAALSSHVSLNMTPEFVCQKRERRRKQHCARCQKTLPVDTDCQVQRPVKVALFVEGYVRGSHNTSSTLAKF